MTTSSTTTTNDNININNNGSVIGADKVLQVPSPPINIDMDITIDSNVDFHHLEEDNDEYDRILNLELYEEREKRELEWLVKSTSQIIAGMTPTTNTNTNTNNHDNDEDDDSINDTNTNKVGTLPPHIIDKILPVATTWVRRSHDRTPPPPPTIIQPPHPPLAE